MSDKESIGRTFWDIIDKFTKPFQSHPYRSLIIVLIIFFAGWGIAHWATAPGKEVPVWGLFHYIKPPIPTSTPIPTPTPTATLTPTPTATPTPSLTAVVSVTVLRSQPDTISSEEVIKMVQIRGFRQRDILPDGDFLSKFEAKTFKGIGVVIDYATGLMWQQGGSATHMSWDTAHDYVNLLNQEQHAGFSDWRLPTIEEFFSLLEPKEENGLYINPIFDVTQAFCWTADSTTGLPESAVWYVRFDDGGVWWHYLSSPLYYVRAVRSRQN